ncbi:MAG: DUF2721 domain-containing protein [Deltaproteobacteria bacterium]|nr:DUF2721 domain-containing protein [Deltaproteobacteria bacterium]
MDIDLTTPALLFPAISVLMLAYTNRFLALAALIRALHVRNRDQIDASVLAQIGNLRHRVQLVRNMQALGGLSLLLCVVCMFVLFAGYMELGKVVFAVSVVLLTISLGLSLWEIQISVRALNIHLHDLEAKDDRESVGKRPAGDVKERRD